MTYYSPLCILLRGINEFLSCLCYRTSERWETPHPISTSYGPFASDFHWQTYTQQFPQNYDTSSGKFPRNTYVEIPHLTTALAYTTHYSEAGIHSANPVITSQIKENTRGKGSHYHRHGHTRRERSYLLDENLKTHGIQNNSRPQQRPSKHRRKQMRNRIENEGSSIQTKQNIIPRRMPRERSGILSVNADDISNSSHDAVSGRRTKNHRVRFA